jgi:type I restriction enzyme R subunit
MKNVFPTEVNDRAIDAWFDRITDGLSEAQKADLKRKYARKGEVYSADDRIRLIASISPHFSKNIDEGERPACLRQQDFRHQI